MKTIKFNDGNNRWLYIWDCYTPYGFKYRGFSNSIERRPYSAVGEPRINLIKR